MISGKQQHQIQRVTVGICIDEKSIKFVCSQTDSEAVLEVETDLIIDQPEVFVAVTVNPFENVQIGVVE